MTLTLIPTRPRLLVVVRRDQAALIPRLQARFGSEAAVILDRRKNDRRQAFTRLVRERRRGERRRPLMDPEEQLWRAGGYRLVYRAG